MTDRLKIERRSVLLKHEGMNIADDDRTLDEGLFIIHKAQPFPKEESTAEEVSRLSLGMQGAGPGRQLQCAITQWCPRDHCGKHG